MDKNLKLQLETLIEIRDNAITLYRTQAKYFEKQLLEVAVATLKSYKTVVHEWLMNPSINMTYFNTNRI